MALGERLDVGLSWFSPRRSAAIAGNAFGADERADGNARQHFLLPEFGYTRPLNADLVAGLAVYGNGGMNTGYDRNPYARFGSSGRAGVDLQQLFVSPTLAYRVAPGHSVGLSANLAWQRFAATGLGAFRGLSAHPDQVTDRGHDHSTGAGLRLGYLGDWTDWLSVGASWSSKIRTSRLDKYAGLFADGGRFDIPENYSVGLALRPAPGWTVALDVQTIRYSRVAAVGNGLQALLQGVPLGAADGPGFGWREMTTTKIGLQYQLSPAWTLRGGYSHGRQPVPAQQTFFNILAPGVVQDHVTAGFTWQTPGARSAWTGYLALARGHTVQGQGSIPAGLPPAGFGGGEASVRLKETLLGLSWAQRF